MGSTLMRGSFGRFPPGAEKRTSELADVRECPLTQSGHDRTPGSIPGVGPAPVPDLFNQKVDGVAWRSKPSWYTVATEDRTIQPELERFVAKRMGATTVELRSSHVPMLSQPQAVLDVIRNAAKAIQKSKAA